MKNADFSRNNVLKMLSEVPDVRLPLPAAYSDPAFNRCVMDALEAGELIDQFDRLYGCKMARIGKGAPIEQVIDKVTGFQDEQLRKFSEFVHDSVYLRLPSEALHALRITELESIRAHSAN